MQQCALLTLESAHTPVHNRAKHDVLRGLVCRVVRRVDFELCMRELFDLSVQSAAFVPRANRKSPAEDSSKKKTRSHNNTRAKQLTCRLGAL